VTTHLTPAEMATMETSRKMAKLHPKPFSCQLLEEMAAIVHRLDRAAIKLCEANTTLAAAYGTMVPPANQAEALAVPEALQGGSTPPATINRADILAFAEDLRRMARFLDEAARPTTVHRAAYADHRPAVRPAL
jgi:hypothetical protein